MARERHEIVSQPFRFGVTRLERIPARSRNGRRSRALLRVRENIWMQSNVTVNRKSESATELVFGVARRDDARAERFVVGRSRSQKTAPPIAEPLRPEPSAAAARCARADGRWMLALLRPGSRSRCFPSGTPQECRVVCDIVTPCFPRCTPEVVNGLDTYAVHGSRRRRMQLRRQVRGVDEPPLVCAARMNRSGFVWRSARLLPTARGRPVQLLPSGVSNSFSWSP